MAGIKPADASCIGYLHHQLHYLYYHCLYQDLIYTCAGKTSSLKSTKIIL